MSRRTFRTPPEALTRLIEALAQGETVADACKVAGIARQTAYSYRQSDEDFALRWADAIEEGTEELEKVARRRAVEGSDNLLIFLLKARRPEVYRERSEVRASVETIRTPSSAELHMLREAGQDPEIRDALIKVSKTYADIDRRLAEGAS